MRLFDINRTTQMNNWEWKWQHRNPIDKHKFSKCASIFPILAEIVTFIDMKICHLYFHNNNSFKFRMCFQYLFFSKSTLNFISQSLLSSHGFIYRWMNNIKCHHMFEGFISFLRTIIHLWCQEWRYACLSCNVDVAVEYDCVFSSFYFITSESD